MKIHLIWFVGFAIGLWIQFDMQFLFYLVYLHLIFFVEFYHTGHIVLCMLIRTNITWAQKHNEKGKVCFLELWNICHCGFPLWWAMLTPAAHIQHLHQPDKLSLFPESALFESSLLCGLLHGVMSNKPLEQEIISFCATVRMKWVSYSH